MTDDTSAALGRIKAALDYKQRHVPLTEAQARAILAHIAALEARAEKAEGLYQSEYTIVDRIWQLLGNPSYEELGGRSIYDLIDALKARAKEAEAREAALRSVLEKIADEQKVYRGHGDYAIEPAYSAEEAQCVARQALAAAPAAPEKPYGRYTCPTCDGGGEIAPSTECPDCDGTGACVLLALAREMGDGDADR